MAAIHVEGCQWLV